MHHQHRDRHVALLQDMARGATENYLPQPGVAVAAHHQQAGAKLGCGFFYDVRPRDGARRFRATFPGNHDGIGQGGRRRSAGLIQRIVRR